MARELEESSNDRPVATGASPDDAPAGAARFVATSWTAVMATRNPETPEARAALGRLCEAYWQPLHDYVLRLRSNEQDARDLTQEFFLRLLDRNLFAVADREKGRFRTFLLASLNNFLRNDWVRSSAAKRGGGQQVESLDEQSEDGQALHEPAQADTPESVYQKSWAASLLRQANQRLAEEYAAAGKASVFSALKFFLETTPDARGYHAVASQLGMTPNAIGVTVHRMRQRLRELIRSEVERTLFEPTPSEVDAEMRFLLELLS